MNETDVDNEVGWDRANPNSKLLLQMFLVGSFSPHACLTLCRLDAGNGLSYVTEFSCRNVTWIQRTATGAFLCTNESLGVISKFHIDVDGGKNYSLRCEASHGTEGKHPTHLVVCRDRFDHSKVAVANYSSGTVSLFRDEEEGLRMTQVLSQELANSKLPSHPHHCLLHPAHDLLYICDLGLDALFVYSLAESVELSVTFSFPVGSGPRHAVLSLCGRWLYVACELSNQLATIAIDTTGLPIQGSEQFHSTMPVNADTEGMAASEILLSADGRFLYVSNRDVRPLDQVPQAGGDRERSSIAVFGLRDGGGRAQLLQCAGSQGRHPRHMALTREGSLLLVANKDTHSFAAFPVDKSTGLLDEAAAVVSACDPRCEEPAFLLEVSL